MLTLERALDTFLLSRTANGCVASTVGWYRRHLFTYLTWLSENPGLVRQEQQFPW